MKFLVVFLLAMGLYANSDLYKLVDDYRRGNTDNIKILLEKYLMDKAYWNSILQGQNTDYGYYESVKYVFLATKDKKNLKLITLDSNATNQSSAIFGENEGDKFTQGDLATPVGVYDLLNRLKNLPQYYGPLAFVTSYPNLYDRLQKKTGYGIWIHGLPLNGDREKTTEGCIAIDNNLLVKYDGSIDYKKAILITSPKELKATPKATLAELLSALFIWRDAWVNNDLSKYLSFYDNSFTRFDGMKIDEFKKYKKRVFEKKEQKSILFEDINIAPYPNMEGKDMYRITFLEDYKSHDSGYKFRGVKELYVIAQNGSMSIVVEK